MSLHSCLLFDSVVTNVIGNQATITVPDTVRSGPPQEPLRKRGIQATGKVQDMSGIFDEVHVIDIGPNGVA